MSEAQSKLIKTVFKIGFTLLAVGWVLSKVHWHEVATVIAAANWGYLLLAFVLFNASKILSSVRLNVYFQHIGAHLSERHALRLYYVGMFYNLFLPTGIGGDGYKVYLLNQTHPNVGVKSLVTATVLDRISGLVPLLFLAGCLFAVSSFQGMFVWLDVAVALGVVLVFPALYVMTRWLFARYLPVFPKTTVMGLAVQLLQLFCAASIVFAMGVQANWAVYLTLFLISSVVAVLPVSIGGVGMRELTFLYGLGLLALPVSNGVAFSVVFFLITATSSLVGAFLRVRVG